MQPHIRIQDLTKIFLRKKLFSFSQTDSYVIAVDNVSLDLKRGETIGLAGESGCGKTTFGRLLVGLLHPDRGRVLIDGVNVSTAEGHTLKGIRSKCRMIFQGLDAALNPFMTVGKIIEEPLKIYNWKSKPEREKRIADVMDLMNLPGSLKDKYPHMLSGGEKRRVSIARAIAHPPEFVVADEPVSALDVSIRAQILELFKKLQKELNLTMVFISHDIGVLTELSDRIIVMYGGKLVEEMPSADAHKERCLHPYSKKLFSSLLQIDRKGSRISDISKEADSVPVATPMSEFPSAGCRYRYVCNLYGEVDDKNICETTDPALEEKKPGHLAACHWVNYRMGENDKERDF